MYVVVYNQVIIDSIDKDSESITLRRVGEGKGWYVKRMFQDVMGKTSNIDSQTGFNSLLSYIEKTQVDAVMVSDISSIANNVKDILKCIELLHEKGVAVYLNKFNLLTLEGGKENPVTKMLLQVMETGAEIEKNQRLNKQRQGVKLAKTKGVYVGRRQGAKSSTETLLKKYKNITELIDSRELSIRAIAKITNRSINTVRKVKQLKGL